jgi:hypothetical protein
MTNTVMQIKKETGEHTMEKLSRSFSKLIAASALALAVAPAAGCGSPPNSVAGAGQAFQRSGKLTALGNVIELNGSYGTGCLVREGQWSVATTAVENTTHPLLDVVRGNAACTLTLDSLRIGMNEASATLFVADAPIPIGQSFQPTGAAFRSMGAGPVLLYGNARLLPDMSFNSTFMIQAIYSDDPNMVSANVSAGFEVVASEAVAGAVPAPNYGIDVTGLSLQVDANNIVTAASGSAVLLDMSQMGESFVITSTDLGANPQYVDVDAAFSAGTSMALAGGNPTIGAAAFALDGVDLSTPQQRTVIVAHDGGGVRSYQVISIRFFAP